MVSLENIEAFMRFLHKVQHVTRVARLPDEKAWRNTAEHTFEITLLAWYIASANRISLDMEKVLKYALAHDLLEAYAGDTPIHDIEAQKTKAEREAAAVAQIEHEFYEFPELVHVIHAYERREDEESKFVYAVDKLIDPINASMEETQSIWRDENISFEFFKEYKDRKIALSDDVFPYWERLLEKIESKKEFFFGA
jgi:putative hydrolase of HD superfamily